MRKAESILGDEFCYCVVIIWFVVVVVVMVCYVVVVVKGILYIIVFG
jgi:hypothetical protein